MSESDDISSKKSWLEKLSQPFQTEPQSTQELVQTLVDAASREVIDSESLNMMQGVLNVSTLVVEDIMIPRAQITTVDIDQPPETFLPAIVESAHSRFPVMGTDKEDVVGILLAKDLLKHMVQHPDEPLTLDSNILRPAFFVPETKRLNSLLREFRINRNHMAVVVDEYGTVSGVVTIEDVLEEIVGNIEDEFDTQEEAMIQHVGDNRYHIKAITRIEDFNEAFGTEFSDEQVDTVGGLILQTIERVPTEKERIVLGDMEFVVLNSDGRMIHAIELTLPEGSE